jgi:hypothetical protein
MSKQEQLQTIERVKKYFFNYSSIFLLLFFTFSFLYKSDNSFNQDLGRHLKLGEIIWTAHQIPKTNLFSYTNPDFPFVNHHWLFEVFVYLANSSIGIQALLVVKVVLLLLSVTIILLIARRANSVLFIPISFLFLHMLRGRVALRPEIFSFLFTTATLYILERFEKHDSKLIYILPVISLAWVNTHIYYPLGILLQLIFLGDIFLKKILKKEPQIQLNKKLRTMTIVVSLSILVLLINPNFLHGALYAFTVFNNYGVTITENQSFATLQKIGFKDSGFTLFYLSMLVVIASLFVGLAKEKLTFKNTALSSLGLILALQSLRSFPYLIFLSLPAVFQNFGYIKNNVWFKMMNGLVVILIALEACLYFSGAYYVFTYNNNVPSLVSMEDAKPALDFMLEKKLPQPLFNNFDIGSYIIYRTYPTYKVFIDGRPEAYPASFFRDTYIPMQESYTRFKQEDKINGFQTVIFSITDQNPRTINFLRNITHDKDWKIVFLDQFMIMLVKKDAAQELNLQSIDLSTLNDSYYNYHSYFSYTNLSNLLFNLGYYEEAKNINQKALNMAPDNPAANSIMAFILIKMHMQNTDAFNEYVSKSKEIFW